MTVFVDFIANIAIWIYLACGLVMLFYIRATVVSWRERGTALHVAEKEAATSRAYHSVATIGLLLLVVGAVALMVTLAPILRRLGGEEWPESMLATPPSALPPLSVTPTPTLERPTRPAVVMRPTSPVSSPTTQPPPAQVCPNPQARITSPGTGAKVQGRVEIRGTANIDQFKYYKVEYGVGETPLGWMVIEDLKYEPVSEGVLVVWDTGSLTPGTYTLLLTVVDISGNYPEPRCRVSVTLE